MREIMAPPREISHDQEEPLEIMTISDPAVVPILYHEQRQDILRILIHGEKTIQELSQMLQWGKNKPRANPGTIKRHLDEMVNAGLIYISRTRVNEYGIKMKYYRAIAKKYVVKMSWP